MARPPAWTDRPEGGRAPLPARPDELPRERVSDLLDEAVARRVAIVTAPAGAGKSTAVAAWLRRLPPMVPRAHLPLEAVRGSFDAACADVCRALPGGAAGILVLDEGAGAADEVRAAAAGFVEHAPPSLHIVWVSRGRPPLPVARLRARGELAEVGANALRFTGEETAALLGAARPGGAAPEVVERLAAATEGWAAALRMAAGALRGGAAADAVAARVEGGWAEITEFFEEEVIAAIPAERRDVLGRAALLPRLSGPALDAAGAGEGGDAALAAAARDGLFVEIVEGHPGEYRMHPLFAAAMRQRFDRAAPGEAAACRRRCAAWCEQQGWLAEAAGLWRTLGDTEALARVVARLLPSLVARGDVGQLGSLLETIPAAALRADPRLAAGRAWALFCAGEVSAAEPLLRLAEAGGESGDGAALAMAVRAQMSLFARRSADAMAQGMEALRRADVGDRELRAAILSTLAVGSVGMGDASGARRSMNEALSTSSREGGADAVQPMLFAAWRAVQGGDMAEGERLYEQVRAQTEPGGAPALPGAAMARSGLADIAYERDDLDAAGRHAHTALRLARAERNAQAEFTAGFTAARVLRARGDAPGALNAVRAALRCAPHLVAMHGFMEALEAECLAFAGEAEAALAWVDALPESAGGDDEFAVIHQARRLSAARILLRAGRADDAARWVEPDGAAAAPGVFAVALLAARAAVASVRGVPQDALAAMRDATRLASRHGYVRSLVDTGDGIAPLVAALLRDPGAEAEPAWVHHLMRVQDALIRQRPIWTAHAPAQPGPRAPLDRLTPREVQVLQLAGAGLSNKGIALRLGSSPATVKKQLLSIFMKLDARSRTHAVVRGRELGLLE